MEVARTDARVHVLYLERADDQRGADGQPTPGVHLNVPGLGPCLCAGCGGGERVARDHAHARAHPAVDAWLPARAQLPTYGADA